MQSCYLRSEVGAVVAVFDDVLRSGDALRVAQLLGQYFLRQALIDTVTLHQSPDLLFGRTIDDQDAINKDVWAR